MNIDFNALTIGEIAQIEELSGQPITALMALATGEGGVPLGKPLAAFAFIFKKREDPAFTWQMALDMPLTEVMSSFGDTDEDPKELN